MKAFSLEIVKFVFTSKMLSANLVTDNYTRVAKISSYRCEKHDQSGQ